MKNNYDSNFITTKELRQIDRLCKKYNYKYSIHNNEVTIKSTFDEWLIKAEGVNNLKLYHKNTASNNHRYHRQGRKKKKGDEDRKFRDFPFIIHSIKKHDNHKLNKHFSKIDKIDRLLKSINK